MLLDSGCAKHLYSNLHEVRECADPPQPVLPHSHITPAVGEADVPTVALPSTEAPPDEGAEAPANLNSNIPCDTQDPPQIAIQAEQPQLQAKVDGDMKDPNAMAAIDTDDMTPAPDSSHEVKADRIAPTEPKPTLGISPQMHPCPPSNSDEKVLHLNENDALETTKALGPEVCAHQTDFVEAELQVGNHASKLGSEEQQASGPPSERGFSLTDSPAQRQGGLAGGESCMARE